MTSTGGAGDALIVVFSSVGASPSDTSDPDAAAWAFFLASSRFSAFARAAARVSSMACERPDEAALLPVEVGERMEVYDETEAGRMREEAFDRAGEGGTGSAVEAGSDDMETGVGRVVWRPFREVRRSERTPLFGVCASGGGMGTEKRRAGSTAVLLGSTDAGSAEKLADDVVGGDMNVLRLSALGVLSAAGLPTESLILASHCPLTRSTDFPAPCPFPPIFDGLRPRSAPLRPSIPAAILATFRLIGVLGGEASANEESEECGDERAGPAGAAVRSRRRVWYAKILGDEVRPLGGEEVEVGASGILSNGDGEGRKLSVGQASL